MLIKFSISRERELEREREKRKRDIDTKNKSNYSRAFLLSVLVESTARKRSSFTCNAHAIPVENAVRVPIYGSLRRALY